MLGTLRSLPLGEKQLDEFGRAEGFFRSHADNSFRAVFNWSWVTTARNSGITAEQLESLFDRVANSQEDLSNVVCVVCRITIVARLSAELTRRCREWLTQHLSSRLSPDAKFHLVSVAEAAARQGGESGMPEADLSDWIVAIQPVPEDNRGTWGGIADYLCRTLSRDPQQFFNVFQRLCGTSAATIHHLMCDRSLEHLTQCMKKPGVGELVGRLTVAVERATRELGLYLFNTLDIDAFPQTVLQSDEAFASRVLFYETQRTALYPKSIARILVALIPIAEKATDGFREELFDELKLQCHNFAGDFRTELNEIAKDTPMVTRAIEEVAAYFTALDRAHKAGISGMEVAGRQRAAIQQSRHFSRRVSQSAKAFSPLSNMMKHVRLLYGRSTSQFVDGQLRNAMPLANLSSSMELPIVELCDPEEMAMRRLHASAAIGALVARYHKGQPCEGVSDG